MKAPRFLSFLKSMRDQVKKERAAFMMEMTDIACVTWANAEYAKSLKNHYLESTLTKEQLDKRKNPRVFNAADPVQSKAAANIIKSALDLKARLEGLS